MSLAFKKEVYWFFGGLSLFFLIHYFFLGSLNPFSDAVVDINVHDTYFVINSWILSIALFVFLFFDIYLIRALITKFKSKTDNKLFLIFNGLMIVLIACSLKIWELFVNPTEWTIYPPLSAEDIEPETSTFNFYLFLPYLILIILIITQTLVAYKTAQLKSRYHID